MSTPPQQSFVPESPPPGPTVGLVLAAGAASRFGGPKQVAPFRGSPMVQWPVRALRAGGIEQIMVAVGAHHEETVAALEGVQETVLVAEWEEGMSASLRAGVQTAAQLGAGAVIVVLGDEPLLAPAAVRRILASAEADPSAPILRATYAGRPGHPVLLRREVFSEVATLRGDHGARGLEVPITDVPCDGLGSTADVDTREDLARLEGEEPSTD